MLLSTDGIILRSKTLGNDDQIYTILTRKKGVITAFGRNQKKMTRGMGSALELFTYSNFVLFYNKERYTIDHVDSNRVFFGIRSDIEKVSLASYLSELLIDLAPEQGEEGEDYLRLFLNSLAMLENEKRTVHFIKPLFELRVLSMAGYMPDLLGCISCGEWEGRKLWFLPETGAIVCENCRNTYEGQTQIQLTTGEFAAMRHIIYSPMQTLFSFQLPEEALKRLATITEYFLCHQLGKTYVSLEFYHTLFPKQ